MDFSKTNFKLINWFQSLKVRYKIGLGYTVSLSIAVIGTLMGISVSRLYYEQYNLLKNQTLEEATLLGRIQLNLVHTQLHHQRLVVLLDDWDSFKAEYAELKEHAKSFQQDWLKLAQIYENKEKNNQDLLYQDLAKEYDSVIDKYLQKIDNLVIQTENLRLKDATTAQTKFLQSYESQLFIDVENFSEDLSQLRQTSSQALETAQSGQDRVSILADLILQISILLSIGIAMLSAVYISRIINTPIQSITTVAQQVTEKSQFNLKVPVTSQDELGILAVAFNRLIDRINDYTHKLEDSKDDLEIQVKQRTQELENALQELKKAQLQMVQNEKMATLGNLVAGIAHEVNNPIGFLQGSIYNAEEYTQYLISHIECYQENYPDPEEEIIENAEDIDLEYLTEDLPKLLDSMKLATKRIKEISNSLRTFSRADTSQKIACNIHEGIDSTILILKYRLKANDKRPAIKIIKDYGDLPQVKCFLGQLNQVFMNIIANAIDALDSLCEGKDFAEFEPDSLHITISTKYDENDTVIVGIKDNAGGMPKSIQERIFDNLFTTKEVGKGTGLGLAIAKQIIEETHNGKLSCNSVVGEGTEFIINLPINS